MILSDVCDLIVDCPHSTANDEGSGYPLIRTPNIGKGRLILEGVHRVSEEVYNARNFRAVPQDGDLIFAREAPAGNVAVIKNGEKVCLGQRTVLLRPKKQVADSDFLAYYLLSPQLQYALTGTANGATVAHVNLPTIRNLEIDLPDLKTQKKLGSFISAYDNLIENNQKQIKLLEEAAQRLYKQWFIDLKYPGHETTKIQNDLPEGWQEKNISELCLKINAGGTPSRGKKSFYASEGHRWFKTKELLDNWLIESEEHISDEGLAGSSAKLFPPNTIVMAIYASPTLGRLGIMRHESATNQAALCMTADSSKCSWQWLFHKLYELRDEFNAIARGAGQQNISGDAVKSKVVVVPMKKLMDLFTKNVEPIFEKMYVLTDEIEKLKQTRDRLLPKLMSSEIEV